nr:UBX domain-containing protein 1-like [Tanacetum cinerariifolium]
LFPTASYKVPTARVILPLLVKKCSHCRVDKLPLRKSLHCWAQSKMKSHVDKRRTDKKFDCGGWVSLKLQPHRQFRKCRHPNPDQTSGTLPPCDSSGVFLVEPMEILDRRMDKKGNEMEIYVLVYWRKKDLEMTPLKRGKERLLEMTQQQLIDHIERSGRLGLPPQSQASPKTATPMVQENRETTSATSKRIIVESTTKVDVISNCLRLLRQKSKVRFTSILEVGEFRAMIGIVVYVVVFVDCWYKLRKLVPKSTTNGDTHHIGGDGQHGIQLSLATIVNIAATINVPETCQPLAVLQPTTSNITC